MDRLDLLFRILALLEWRCEGRRLGFFVFGGAKFYELRKRVEKTDIDSGGFGGECGLAGGCYPKVRPFWG